MTWSDPRPDSDAVDPISGGGEDPEDVDPEENREEAEQGEDSEPPL
jgi:hypothetical protein